MAATTIRNFIAKALFKKKGAIASSKAVDFSAKALEQRIKNLGINPNEIKSEQELNQILSYVKQVEDQAFDARFGNMLAGSKFDKQADVLDMTGKKIDPRSKIMGGQQAETEADILARLEKENKAAAQKIRDRKKLEDRAIEDFVDDAGGVNPDDPRGIDDFIPDPEDMAQGGRAGYFKGIGPVFNFLNKKSPMKAYTDYLKSVKKRMKEGKEAEVAGEVIPIAAGGALITNQLKKKLKAMNEEQKKEKEKKADGGRIGLREGNKKITRKEEDMGPYYETNDPEEALKEIVKRMINVDPAKIPLSENMQLMFDLDRAQIGGQKDIGGGELSFGINKGFGRDDTGIGFNFRKKFKDGSDMNRRSFLKILGGLASIPILGKFLKPVKTAKGIKSVPIIKTDNVPGKPEWFDALVNKVILEGDDVTKKFATADRQSIHSKTLDDGSVVRVTEDVDDGAVRVEYESEANVYGDPVQMEYRKPLPDEGAPNPAAEFSTAESGPVGRQASPDDYELDVDEISGSSISDLDSDVSKLKEFATGKGPTIREIIQNKKRRDKAAAITDDIDGAASDAVIRRQGEYYPDDDGLASGGIARMLGE